MCGMPTTTKLASKVPANRVDVAVERGCRCGGMVDVARPRGFFEKGGEASYEDIGRTDRIDMENPGLAAGTEFRRAGTLLSRKWTVVVVALVLLELQKLF
jgi:hypothetical protein